MGIQFLDSINLNLSEVENMIVQKLAAHPSVTQARFYFNTTARKFYGHNGLEWIDLNNNGWRPAVSTFADLALLSNLEDGLAVYVNATDQLFTWDAPTSSWKAARALTNMNQQYSEYRPTVVQSIPSNATTALVWNNFKPTHNLWSAAAPTNFVIPSGVVAVRVQASAYIDNIRRDRLYYIEVTLNGVVVQRSEGSMSNGVGDAPRYYNVYSPIIPVVQGDVIQVRVFQNSGGAHNVILAGTFAQVEVFL